MNEEFLGFLEEEGYSDLDEISKAIPSGKKFEVSFDFDVINKSDRVIRGIASVEDVDRENEIITKAALQNALDGFKQLPILHLQHTERPAGLITKGEITDRGFEIESKIPKHKQWDDIWERIEKGDLSKYSIHGRRRVYSPECRLSVRSRDSPCVTNGLYLDSVSIVKGDTAVNQKSMVEIVKAMRDEAISTENIITSKTDGNEMTEETEVIVKAEDIPKLIDEQIVTVSKAFDSKLDGLIEKNTALEAELLEIKKSFDTLKNQDSGVKALNGVIDELKAKNEEITKANTELTAKVDKMGEEIIKKGQDIVIIPDQIKDTGRFRTTNKGV